MRGELNKCVFIASDFFPSPGGIAQYTYDMAIALDRIGSLDCLIAPLPQKGVVFRSLSPKMLMDNKLGSLLVIIQQRLLLLYYLIKVSFAYDRRILINSLFVDYSGLAINICKWLGLKYWIVLHGLDLIELQKKDQQKLERYLRGASGFICNSKATRELLYQSFPSEKLKPLSIVYPGFEKRFLEQKVSEAADSDFLKNNGLKGRKVICTIARLVKRKGIDIAIEGLAKFLHENEDWMYVIAGTGPELSKLKSLVNKQDLTGKILFVGYLSVEDKFTLLSYSRVFIMPNHLNNNTDFEGFGISFVEAQYFQNWIIAGKSGGVVESVDSKTGHFVDFDNGLDPVEQIAAYIENISTYDSPNRKGKLFVLNHFEMECLTKQVENVDFG